MNSLSHHTQINKGFSDWRLSLYFSKPVLRHFTHFIDGMSSIGFTGKLTQIHAYSHHPKHRTTLGHFLQKSPWQDKYLLQQSKQFVHRQIEKSLPLFYLLDDTISKKTKPSSQALHPIKGCGFHFSHTEGKSVWGHQVVQLMAKSNGQAFPYDFRLFQKDKTDSKIQLSVDLLSALPQATQPTYVLCDSWYTSKSIIEAAFSGGMYVIGALKTNRIIYPSGIRMQVKEFATHIDEKNTDLVTVGREQYRVYRYEGALNDLELGVVVLCWPANEPMETKKLRCFLSTDTELTTQEILDYYSERWAIETYFQQVKGYLGFQGVQVRSERAIQRYWLLVQFAYLFIGALQLKSFSTAIQQMRRDQFGGIIEFVYNEARTGTSLDQIKNELFVA
ncbi:MULTISPECIES: IS701 family transposase [Bacilli]|uniref:IS701 family transposase n=1 Tax=Bacilli TaxID=91061 RepID=UPI0015F6817F|nr:MULTISPECIES: IS701 family transposase [Bacilli]MDT2688425.1 IS701 family transposase [Enterococcus gallinarum]MDT2706932.1 IS701 family transposase [Enterococcus dispar]QMU12143.1 IS701 family transposase [Mammaliicoccus lentus]